MRKVKIGEVGVDSASLMITDPCYIKDFKSGNYNPEIKKDKSYSVNGACCATDGKNQGGAIGIIHKPDEGLGVVFRTGIGDGVYPVYATLDNMEMFGERVVKVEIDFDEHVMLGNK
tara:strand:- start:353 stop:700 length:348 start_codon:yes stop_codon:yes gene_type:complete